MKTLGGVSKKPPVKAMVNGPIQRGTSIKSGTGTTTRIGKSPSESRPSGSSSIAAASKKLSAPIPIGQFKGLSVTTPTDKTRKMTI